MPVPLPLEHHRGDKTLHLRSSELLLLSIFKGEWPLDDVLANIVLLGQVEQLPNLAGTLGSQPAGDGVVGQSGNLGLSLLDDGHGQDGEAEIPGLTDNTIPRRLGPKRASKIRKLFNLTKEDDVCQYVIK